MYVVESYMRELHKLAGTCTDCENLCCDFGMSVEIEECSSEEQLESEETRTTAEILNDSRLTYTKAFMLSLSNLHICKDLPEDFDPSALRDLRLTYTKEFMLSLSNLQICKDLPKDFDPSALRCSRLTYTKTFILRLVIMQVGGSNSYASHSSKGTKSLTNTACTAQEDVQSKNDTFQDDVVGDKSTHWSKQIANLSEAQKSVNKFVDEEKSHCKTPGSINVMQVRPFSSSLQKEVSLQHTDFPGIETRCLKGPCTGRMENGIHTANILAAESHENLKLNWESKEDFETEISNELLLGEAFFPSQKNLYERISETNELQPNEFFLASVLSDCGAFGTDGEGIADSIFDCELELDEIEESESPFDDFWTEILDVIHLEQESRDSYSADTVNITESEVTLHIPDEDELISLNYQEEPKDPKIPNVDTSIDLDFVEDEINLPDEDSLISVDHLLSLSNHCSEVTFVGRTDRLEPNFTSDSTGHTEVAHCYEKSFLPGRKVSSSATHRKPYPHQISSQTPCIHVNPEIPTFHPLDLYFTCSNFKNIREEKLVHYYPPAIYFYPWSNIHHESSMKTAPAMEKKYEHLEQYPMLYQPDNSLQQMELLRESQTDPIEQVVYDVVQQWDAMQQLPETYHQQLHYPGFGFPI
ncbi:hypothetical protein H5410_016920 [Solanum commersonii]|uniref:Uncharacterized protein n=1 Tax=Solanum commersonii TaxID=4109 RepID=A0A9J5ZXY1_SOLCO|nr:hypothetical protein H5410_016920 [Solanum commersonii]